MRFAILFILVVSLTSRVFAQPVDADRTLQTFDFEERKLGNFEDLPMHWEKVEGPGMPHYVNGMMVNDRRRSGASSFRMDLDGGSVAYRYEAGRIRVSQEAHYRVEAFVQTTPLPSARARLTAYLTDIDRHILPKTIRHSAPYVSGEGEQTWTNLSLDLSTDDPKAEFLVVQMELLQPSAFAESNLGERALFPQDIKGSAWFDDVSVAQVPQVAITTNRPGNLFRRSEPLRLTINLNDRFTEDLSAAITVTDARGRVVHQRSGALATDGAEVLSPGQMRVPLVLPDLPAGWYRVTMQMSSQGRYVGREQVDLVRLSDEGPASTPDDRFGLIATDLPFDAWDELPAILKQMGAGRVKLGVWSAAGDIQQADPDAFNRLLSRLQELQITPTACLLDLPPTLAQKMVGGGSWLSILRTPAEVWQSPLAFLIARHANHLQRWQLGADGSDAFVTDPRMREVYDKVYNQFSGLVANPDLAMPWPAWYELPKHLPATVALHIKPDVLPQQIPLYMADIKPRQGQNLSVYLEPIDAAKYGRELQVQDLARRVCFAMTADAKRIDIRLPYDVKKSGDRLIKQPSELLLAIRTILTTLSGTTYRGKVPLAEGVEAFLFERGGQGILMLWDRSVDGQRKSLALSLGQRPLRVDLLGNVTPLIESTLQKQDGAIHLDVGPMPIFLIDIDAPAAQLRTSVKLDNDHIESSFKPHTRILSFTNPYKQSVSGTIRLRGPAGWVVSPPTVAFSMNPGETVHRELSIEFPYNSFAGDKTITAELNIQADRPTTFTVPITLHLGLSDVGLQSLALRDGNDVIVQQIVTNYGTKKINYASFAVLPGEARQERLITDLAPGQTTIKKYRFVGVKFAPESKVRSGLKEQEGTRILNDEVTIQ